MILYLEFLLPQLGIEMEFSQVVLVDPALEFFAEAALVSLNFEARHGGSQFVCYGSVAGVYGLLLVFEQFFHRC